MKVVKSIAAMQRLSGRWRRAGRRIGLVPTMGFLHEGHLSLIRVARRRVGASGQVVVSIYVNPTQFGPAEDWVRSPRDLPRDLKACRAAGVDVVFAPSDAAMYPGKARVSTHVNRRRTTLAKHGGPDASHAFRGVTTVVAKLFHLVQPDVAVFGAKDWQQAAVIRRMVTDLNFQCAW